MRLLGIDFGGKRIGVAVGLSEERIATARKPLAASGTLRADAQTIARLAHHEEAEAVVLGVPESEDGKMARVCRMLGEEIKALGLVVHFVDESLTSYQAESAMMEAGLKGSQRRKLSDGEAACRILERHMEDHASRG